MKEIQLIKLYCTVCQHYYTIISRDVQRLSNNFCPKFSDEECITIYLWGIANRKFEAKESYKFIKDYWSEWFPKLPSYQNFNRRICNLAEVFVQMAGLMLSECEMSSDIFTYLIDSLPIVVANSKRSSSAKVAREICDKGYCASKGMYYYGLKLHSLNQKQPYTLPKLFMAWVTPASVSDLTSAKQELLNTRNIDVYGDKIYNDATWFREMKDKYNVSITAPVKMKKGQTRLNSADKIYNSLVSSIRQPLESFFNWLQQRTNIQSASKVRSTNGLIAFVFARLALSFSLF